MNYPFTCHNVLSDVIMYPCPTYLLVACSYSCICFHCPYEFVTSFLIAQNRVELNSSARGRFELNFRWVMLKIILVIDGWGISCEITLRWMSLDLSYDKSTLIQVMAWCHQATSHYLSQCWPRFKSPYGVTRPQCVNVSSTGLDIYWTQAWLSLRLQMS